MKEYALIPKILPAFRRLRRHYESKEENTLKEIVDNAKIHIDVATEYDNWNGGQHGHDVFIFIPDDLIGLVDLDNQNEIFERLREDLNNATLEVENEYIRAVYIKAADDSDPHCQAATSFSRGQQPSPLRTKLWKGNNLRMFISHRDKHKLIAHQLANYLEPFGISAFVAHDSIKPMKEWENEIRNGLNTMEVMLVLLTDDFHESEWTDQEVGFALAKGIPIICVKVGTVDPKGFLGSQQALKASYDDITQSVPDIYQSLTREIGQGGRLKGVLIDSFISSTNYIETIERLTHLTQTADRLTEKEFARIVEGYEHNDQIYNCGGIRNKGNWFKRYLESATGKQLEFEQGKILDKSLDDSNEIPF